MTPLFLYLVKVALFNALILGVYYFVVRRGSNISLMRGVLLAAIVLPLLLPLLPRPGIQRGGEDIPVYVMTLPEISSGITISGETGNTLFPPAHEMLYCAITLLMLSALVFSIVSVAFRMRKSKPGITPYGKVLLDPKINSPFSFFRWVFFPEKCLENPGADLLLRHEFSHVRRRHSLDRMVSAAFRAFFWFSPFVHLNHRLLSEVHEYQADADAIRGTADDTGYKNLMIAYAGVTYDNHAGNPFSAHLKKRLIMLNQLNPRRLNPAAIAAGIALIAAFALLSSMIQPASTAVANLPETEQQALLPGDTTLIPAEYPGGEAAKIKFLQNNIRYPSEARNNNVQGTVFCQFTVEPDGRITSPVIVSGIGSGCDEEVLRVIALMPAWKPATKGGKEVGSTFVMPVKFALAGETADAVTDDIFIMVENPPQYPGGDEARTAYFTSAIKYPEDARAEKVEGTVYVSFVIEKDGSISNAKVIRGVDPRLDKIAVEAVGGMPAWKPGSQRGAPVRVQYNMPVKFTLEKEKEKTKIPVATSKLSDGREVYNIVEEVPEYPGGMEALYDYLKANAKYTEQAKKEKIEGTVYIGMVVEADGSISNAQILRGIGGGLDDVALKAIRNMPAWKPGKQEGKEVPVRFNIPVKFRLDPSAPGNNMELPEKIVYQGREVYYKAEQMPVYPGGNEAMLAHFKNYIPGLVFDTTGDLKGTIYISFIVETDGTITPANVSAESDSKVEKGKLMEAMKKMKGWKPGKTRGTEVPVKLIYYLKINE
ncbi:MAG TPA: M56 family metallopeptidase [Lentimicrobium sp.]|nr:M56 family metallopeptidase [Lentimicrobium sp.]